MPKTLKRAAQAHILHKPRILTLLALLDSHASELLREVALSPSVNCEGTKLGSIRGNTRGKVFPRCLQAPVAQIAQKIFN